MTPRTPPEIGGMGHAVKRKEDPALSGARGLCRRRPAAGHALPRHCAQPLCPRHHQEHRYVKALAIPGVVAVITGEDLAKYNLHWMPTLMSDTQMVLPVEKVMYQAQEVAAVLATDCTTAMGWRHEVACSPAGGGRSLQGSAARCPGIAHGQTGQEGQPHLSLGSRRQGATDKTFRDAEVTVKQDVYIPRIHVSSIETCGCVAQFDRISGQLTVWMTTQAPHAIRTVFALVAGHVGLAEHKISHYLA